MPFRLWPCICDQTKIYGGLCKRGEAKNSLGRYPDAISDCYSAISIYAKAALAYQCRGYAYFKLGKTREHYRKAVADYVMTIQLEGSGYKLPFKYRDEAVAAMATAEGP